MIVSLVALMERQRAVFGAGTSDGGGTTSVATSDLYNVASNSWASGGNIAGSNRTRGGAFSWRDAGYLVGGSALTGVDKWKWTDSSWATSTALTTGVRTQFAFNGSGGKGVSVGGFTTTTVNSGEKFTKSSETWATSGTLTSGRVRGSSASSTSVGYSLGGSTNDSAPQTTSSTTTGKYTYSSDTDAAGTALGTTVWEPGLGCLSSPTKGYAVHGHDSSGTGLDHIQKYTFSGDTVVDTASLGTAKKYECCASFAQLSILAGGADMAGTTAYTTVDIWNHAAETISGSTALGTSRTRAPGISSAPPFV